MATMQPAGSTSTRRARARRLRVVGFALMALGAFPVGGTFGATNDAAGWWSQTSTPLPLNPTAPHVQEGQLHVQGGDGGATAIAALRWTLSEDESMPTLTLAPADGSVLPPSVTIAACKATSPWDEAHGGAWADAPEYDCATSTTAVVAEDGSAVEFDLAALVDGTSLDVVIVPGAGGTPFSLTFDRPGPEALTTQSSTSSDSFGGGSGFAPSDEPASSPSSGGAFDPPAAPAASAPSFTAPATEAASPPPAADTPAAAPEAPAVAARPAASTSSDGDRARSLGLLLILTGAAVVAWAWMASSTAGPAAAPATAESPSTGLGRFARPRQSAPPATS